MNFVNRVPKVIFLLVLLFCYNNGFSQLAIGQWRDHLSYLRGISVTEGSGKMFCATQSGIFTLNKSDNSLDRLSKINGLSDVGVNTLRFNDYNGTLLIAYQNANIDLIDGNKIYNMSDIKRAVITGKKTINNIYFKNQLAYLACGFGIVVVDMNQKQINDTYPIGINAGFNVHDITSDANYIYAATDSGVYSASWGSINLADPTAWTKFSSLPKGIYNTIVSLGGKIYVNLSEPTKPWGSDTIYWYDGIQWTKFPGTRYTPVRKFETDGNKLLVSMITYASIYDNIGTWVADITNTKTGYDIDPYQSVVDKSNSNAIWMADNINGLTKYISGTTGTAQSFVPNGPNTSNVYSMTTSGNDLWVAPGARTPDTWTSTYFPAELYHFNNESWTNVKRQKTFSALDTLYDIVSIAVDPKNPQHVYAGALGAGLVEVNNGAVTNVWNEKNSSLQIRCDAPNYHWLGVYGSVFDTLGNLWMTNCYAQAPLSIYKADGTWQAFNLNTSCPTVGPLLINKYGQKWMLLPRGNGILVFSDNETWATNDDQVVQLTVGGSPIDNKIQSYYADTLTTDIHCMAEDKDGAIWVGTTAGVQVFFCPDQVFQPQRCRAQPIYIQQDTHTQLLLATEEINTMAVDGANRKWFGTENSGVFLMSADGTQQIHHFTVDNSPLLSNEIFSIAINQKTGEVFFGTGAGIISYRSDAIEGTDDFGSVYVFPNPVKPEYEGPIAITGLAKNSDVKITDITGSVVFHTKALGGQAIWYGKNFNGEKVHTGVYLVFCNNEDGSKTFVSKILFIN